MKFKEKVCECGFDLTTATPTRIWGTEDCFYSECPNCQRPCLLEPAPEPPVVRGGRRRASEPEPVAEPEPEPTSPASEPEE